MKNTMFALILLSFGYAEAVPMNADKGSVEFLAVGKPAFVKIKGEGKGPTGQFELKRSGMDLKLNAELVVDMQSLSTGIDLRDSHMKEKYLLTPQYKTATLKIKDATLPASVLGGTGTYKIPGTLILKNVEKPVEISLSLEGTGEQIKIDSSFKINLAEFSIDIPKYAGITVANDVEIKVLSSIAKVDLKEVK